MEYYLAIRKNDYPTFAAMWMGLEEIILSEISQAKKDNYHMVSLIYGTQEIAGILVGEGREGGGVNRSGNEPRESIWKTN